MMAAHDDTALRAQLRDLDDQLAAMIAIADDQGDHLLGALLCDAHAHVVQRHVELSHA